MKNLNGDAADALGEALVSAFELTKALRRVQDAPGVSEDVQEAVDALESSADEIRHYLFENAARGPNRLVVERDLRQQGVWLPVDEEEEG